ncbi:dihydroneopterin aldolase [Alicyclobacillaceae bacterium I2511]|jgi:dihydroneopterin aldolase|nr:dihydroneopterin aldolase [Alicyclobacillaceae bacterium I2511]
MDKITLTKMPFYAYHGVMAEERSLGQRFIVNLELFLNLEDAGHTDRVKDTVNYARIYDRVKEIVEGKPFRLIEALAEHIAQELLRQFGRVQGVHVEVEKPGAPVAGVLENVSVSIERWRDKPKLN